MELLPRASPQEIQQAVIHAQDVAPSDAVSLLGSIAASGTFMRHVVKMWQGLVCLRELLQQDRALVIPNIEAWMSRSPLGFLCPQAQELLRVDLFLLLNSLFREM